MWIAWILSKAKSLWPCYICCTTRYKTIFCTIHDNLLFSKRFSVKMYCLLIFFIDAFIEKYKRSPRRMEDAFHWAPCSSVDQVTWTDQEPRTRKVQFNPPFSPSGSPLCRENTGRTLFFLSEGFQTATMYNNNLILTFRQQILPIISNILHPLQQLVFALYLVAVKVVKIRKIKYLLWN